MYYDYIIRNESKSDEVLVRSCVIQRKQNKNYIHFKKNGGIREVSLTMNGTK